jgi:putative ABC transport system permease protein
LRVHKLRSALTMLGIVIGVGTVITMVAVGAGTQARVAEQIQSLGANILIIWPGTVNLSGVRLGAGAQATLSEDDAWAIQREVPLVEVVAPYARGNAVYSNLNWWTGIVGMTPEYLTARDWDVISGRALTQEEVGGASKVALLGQTVAWKLFGDDDPVGQVIRIKKVPRRTTSTSATSLRCSNRGKRLRACSQCCWPRSPRFRCWWVVSVS